MNLSDIPYKFQRAWAALAAGGYVAATIPAASSGARAGQDLGFPPATATPVGAGGTPPDISDFNGALLYVTKWLAWLQTGSAIPYDVTFQGWISGYPKGAVVASLSTANRLWLSTVDGNTTDPDAGGAGWTAFAPYGSYVAKAGDVMTGVLRMASQGINYAGIGDGHNIAYGWDGVHINGYVDTTYVGALAFDAKFASYLPLTGGTLSGPGHLNVGGNLGVATSAVGGWTMYWDGLNNIYRERIDGWCHGWTNATGAWFWNSPTLGMMTLDGSGALWTRNGISTAQSIAASFTVSGSFIHSTGTSQFDNTLYFRNGIFDQVTGYGMQSAGINRIFTWGGNWLYYWDSTNGDVIWTGSGGGTNQYMKLNGSGDLSVYLGNFTLQGGSARGYKWTGPSWDNASDRRIKRDIEDYTAGLPEILALRPRTFIYNGLGGSPSDGERQIGLIADEAREPMPEMVHVIANPHVPDGGTAIPDMLGLNMSALPLALVNAVQTLTARVATLEAALAARA